MSINNVELCGFIADFPIFSHETHGVKYYKSFFRTQRMSGTNDVIPLFIREEMIEEKVNGDEITKNKKKILGTLRTCNTYENEKCRLHMVVYVYSMDDDDRDDKPDETNSVTLSGVLCRVPIFRTTPMGRDICDFMIAVSTAYKKTHYIPCIAWANNAKKVSEKEVGDIIFIEGRFQSRMYEKKNEDGEVVSKTAYEISANKIIDIV